MPAKRTRGDNNYDITPKADDNPFILSILNYVPKPSLKEFIKALSPERRSQLYEIVMPQKNGDRVMKAFISEMGIMPQLEEHKPLKTYK